MKAFRKIMAVTLAVLLVCSFAGCDKKETKKKKKSSKTAQQIVVDAPLALDIFSDADVTIGFDKNGMALAIITSDATGDLVLNACKDIKGKSGVAAVNMVVQALVDNNLTSAGYVVIRQRLDSTLPTKDFLTNITAEAQALLGNVKLFTISNEDMDETGYISGEYATKILLYYAGADSEILNVSALTDGCYIITCKQGDQVTDFSVSGYSGVIGQYQDLIEQPVEEEDLIPENEQFDIPSDNPEV